MSGDAQHAESLTQDVFVRAWEKLSSFYGKSQFSTWLHRLAINVVLQDRRSRGRRQAREHTVENLEHYTTAVTELPNMSKPSRASSRFSNKGETGWIAGSFQAFWLTPIPSPVDEEPGVQRPHQTDHRARPPD